MVKFTDRFIYGPLPKALHEVNLGPRKEKKTYRSLIADKYPQIEAAAQKAELKNGVAIIRLGQVEHHGELMDLVDVRMEPGKKVGAHIHESGGEFEFPLTPAISVRGTVLRDESGYILDNQGNITHTITEQKIVMPGDSSPIPEGDVHEYRNPMRDTYADVLFVLPHTHATAEDKKLAVSPDISKEEMQKLVKNFLHEQRIAERNRRKAA